VTNQDSDGKYQPDEVQAVVSDIERLLERQNFLSLAGHESILPENPDSFWVSGDRLWIDGSDSHVPHLETKRYAPLGLNI
jgi:hypothetical protein